MVRQFICGTVHEGIADNSTWNRVQNSVEEFCNQMNQFSTDHTYGEYTDHGWAANPGDQGTHDDEDEYLNQFAEDIAEASRNNEITTTEGDAWVILDSAAQYGYGSSDTYFVDLDGDGILDDNLHICRTVSLGWVPTSDPTKLTTSFIIHELSHLFGADHNHGKYAENSDGDIYDVSPMATSYVRADIDAESPDTCWGGSGNTPLEFGCNNYQPNKISKRYCNGCSDWCLHTWDLEYCTKNEVDKGTPL